MSLVLQDPLLGSIPSYHIPFPKIPFYDLLVAVVGPSRSDVGHALLGILGDLIPIPTGHRRRIEERCDQAHTRRSHLQVLPRIIEIDPARGVGKPWSSLRLAWRTPRGLA